MTTLISTLFSTVLVLALITLVLGGICGMANKWRYCTRCCEYFDELGNRTSEPPNRLDIKPEACQECCEKGLL